MACHTRSNSFPSRPHPIIQEVDEHLCRLRSSEATSTSSLSSSISHKLNSLQDLYDSVDRLLLLPQTQQALAQQQNDKLLDGSLRLLDVCSTAKDSLSQTKECIQNLQSIMRRKRGGESGEVRKYLTSRKMVKKTIHKAMGNLKGSTFFYLNKDSEIVNKLREVEGVTITVLESLMSFISGPKSKSLVFKLMQSKKVACEEESEATEFAQVDAALNLFVGHKTSADNAQNQLDKLESCIQDQEEGIECLYRQLIKTRVSFLNILNH